MKAKTTRKNIFLLAVPTILVLIIMATLLWFFDRVKAADAMRVETTLTLSKAQALLISLTNAETATRGYLLTGDKIFLKPYLDTRDTIAQQVQQLRSISITPAAKMHLNILAPLITEKMQRLSDSIALRDSAGIEQSIARVRTGDGKRLMDSIRTELDQYHQIQTAQYNFYDNDYRANTAYLFAFIVFASVFMLLFAQAFAYGIYRNIHQRLLELVHVETKRSLDKQEAMNQQLNLAYTTVQESEKKLEVTLNSIADAVIATDGEGRVTLMNHVAELLTGWLQEEGLGCAIGDIFHIIDKESREPLTTPVMETLLHGSSQGSNNTILVLRDGYEYNIATSCAPIRDHDGQVIGAVLVFRDITAENAAQQALLDSTALVQTILETVADGIVTFHVHTNRIETVNAAAEKMFGYSADELIGQRFSVLAPELSEDKGSLDYYNASNEQRANGIVREVSGRLKSGQTFPMEIAVSEMRLGGQRYFTGVLRNITARKHADAVMRESEDRYRNLFNTIDEGFCTIEMVYENNKPVDFRFLEVNPSFEKQMGLSNVMGKRILELVPEFDKSWFEICGDVVETGEPVRFTREVHALNRWLDVYAGPERETKSRKLIVLFTDITERKRSEKALRESDERVRLATEATGVGIWEWNLINNTVRWDAQMFRIYGVTPTADGFIGYDDWVKLIAPEDLDQLQKNLRERIRLRKNGTREFRILRPGDKSFRDVRSVEAIRTNEQGEVQSVVGTNLDITELKRTEDTLRENERHLRTVINALPVAIYTTNADGALTHFNEAAVEFSGRTPELGVDQWCIGWKLFNIDGSPLTHDESPMAVALKEDRQLLGTEAIAERPDGTRIWFTAYPTPLHDAQGKLIGGINMLIDVTERKRLDQLILENNIELKKSKNQAEKANRAKSDFLSNMSHELRTPLSAILGFAQLLEAANPPPSPIQKRSINQILQAGWYLLDLINEILDLTLIESGKLSISMEPVSLVELMRECETMIEPQANKNNITLDIQRFDPALSVNADHTRLKQALINLLSNAVKYNRKNGMITVSCTETSPGRLRICVQDTGEGLSQEQLSQLFQPFNRLGQENGGEEGTGIGLVMTKRLVELMGGQITVSSVVGEGTAMSIFLDMTSHHKATDTDKPDTAEIAPIIIKNNTPQRTLLYVEDNPANLMLIEDILKQRPDITLLTAQDGYSGIELARVTQPDLILMDINLPGLNGIEVLKILSKDPVTTHIPVIALSANAVPRDIEKGIEAGFFRYLTKPIKINEFINTLEMTLDFTTRNATRANEEKMT